MYPILISLGSVHIYSLSVFILVSWAVFSFIFWKEMKEYGIDEEKIFDLTFYASITGFVFSRIFFVLLNLKLFGLDPLKITAIWIIPGLSIYGAIIGSILIMVILIRKYKIRLGYLLDSLAFAFPIALISINIGSLLDGSRIGKITNLPWAIHYLGYSGKRHPVQVYEILSLIVILVVLYILRRTAAKNKWPYGIIGIWFIFQFAVSQFILEIFKVNSIYWMKLSVNQWINIILFCESVGILYVKSNIRINIQQLLKGAYNAVSQRFSKRNS
jgi:prolipoprotein diacylglyceryltransferase